MNTACPCQSNLPYAQCCQPLHQGQAAPSALALMRSRYTAYVLHDIDYIVATTVPSQQPLLDKNAIAQWSNSVQWQGLDIVQHQAKIGKIHAQVEFIAHFVEQEQAQQHRELSAFVSIDSCWYFIDPTVPLPSMKTPCICGSGKKFKQCCGIFLR